MIGDYQRWMRSPLGGLIARPWFDRVTLRFLSKRYFPLSRLWAAAGIAEAQDGPARIQYR